MLFSGCMGATWWSNLTQANIWRSPPPHFCNAQSAMKVWKRIPRPNAGGSYRVLLLDDPKHTEQLVVKVVTRVVSPPFPSDNLSCLPEAVLVAVSHAYAHSACSSYVPLMCVPCGAGARCGRAQGEECLRDVPAARSGDYHHSAQGACRCANAHNLKNRMHLRMSEHAQRTVHV